MFKYLLATIENGIGAVRPASLKFPNEEYILNPYVVQNCAVHGQLQAM